MALASHPVPDPPTPPAPHAHAAPARSDQHLAAGARCGDRACFDALLDRYADRVFGFVLARVRNAQDAEEITQETLLRAWRAIERYDARWCFSTWLFTIAHREAIAVLRRRRLALAALQDDAQPAEHASPAPDAIDHAESARDGDVWALASAVLGREEYEALWLRYAEDCPPRDIARILGRTSVGVRVMLHRARERLRALLADPAGSPDHGRGNP